MLLILPCVLFLIYMVVTRSLLRTLQYFKLELHMAQLFIIRPARFSNVGLFPGAARIPFSKLKLFYASPQELEKRIWCYGVHTLIAHVLV